MLHPIGRIKSLNRGNPLALRQIESVAHRALLVRLQSRHSARMSQPDPTLERIAAQFTRHKVEKSGSGYLVLDPRTRDPIARLRPIRDTDRFELLYWSNTKGRWTTFGSFGRMKLMLESAQQIVNNDPMFHIRHSR